MKSTWTRKEIGAANGKSHEWVRRHQATLGLNRAIENKLCKKPVCFRVKSAAPILRRHGLKCPE